MMRLVQIEMSGWPPLAWVARCAGDIELRHGRDVELAPDWAFEGAWAADFGEGSFDQAAVTAGSGVRLRDGEAVFVSSANTIDRLCHLRTSTEEVLVSNSLLALLAAADAKVTDSKYQARATSIVRGIERCRDTIETSAGAVGLTYFRNLTWGPQGLERRDRTGVGAAFRDFNSYREFLSASFAALAANMADAQRRRPLTFLGTLSSGYDANAATALAAEAGCRVALCFETTGGGHPDSGVPAAEALGLDALMLERDGWRQQPRLSGGTEVPFLAAGGGSGLISFDAGRDHLAGTILVSGFYGDSIWNPEWSHLGHDIVRKDASGLGFCEYRLRAGFANCAPAFWAAREVADVVGIGRSEEMAPWLLGGNYDRPIPRRIAEEAGVPRGAFGQAKRGVPKAQPHRDARFLTPASKRDYFAWLRAKRVEPGKPRLVSPALDAAAFAWRDLTLRAHVASGKLPSIRRTAIWERRRGELRRRRRRPTPQRAHLVDWALDRGRSAYEIRRRV